MSVISGGIIASIVLVLSGILKEFTIKGAGVEFSGKIKEEFENIKTEVKVSNKEICGKITNLNQNIQSMNNLINTVISNQLQVNLSPTFNLINNLKEQNESEKIINQTKLAHVTNLQLGTLKSEKEFKLSDEIKQTLDPIIEKQDKIWKKIEDHLDSLPIDYDKLIRNAGYHYYNKELTKSEELIDLVLKNVPNNYTALYNKGKIRFDLKDYKTAKEFIEKALLVDPKSSNAENALAAAYDKLGDEKKSLEHFDKAIELDPENIMALNNKAGRLIIADDLENAEKLIDKIFKINENYPPAVYNKSCLNSHKNLKKETLALLKQAIKLDPEYKIIAKGDDDFKNIKDDPEFIRITSD